MSFPLTRRDLYKQVGVTVSLLLSSLGARPTPVFAAEQVMFRFRVPAAHYETVKRNLHFRGTVEHENINKGLGVIYTFIGVALLDSLADTIIKLHRRLIQPGLTIDTRSNQIQIETSLKLPRGTIVIIDNYGTQLYEPDQIGNSTELIKILMRGVRK
jgi:hypothetical protein